MSTTDASTASTASGPATDPGVGDDDHTGSMTATRHALGAAWPLLIGIALLMLGIGLQGSLVGIRGGLEGFGTTTLGVIMSSYYIGYLIGSRYATRLVANVGHIRVFAALASVASSAVLLHALFLEPVGWFLFRIVSGFCIAGLFVVAESWLNDSATNETRGSLLSMYMVVVSGGLGLGQLLLNLAPPDQAELFLVVSVLVSVALVPAALSTRANPRLLSPAKVSLGEVFRAAPLGVAGVALAGAATGAVFGMGVVYGQQVGLTLATTSIFMLVAIITGAALQWPIGAFSDRVDRRRVIAASAALAAVAGFVGTTNPSGIWLLVTVGLVGGGCFPLYALLNAHTNDWIDPEQIVGAGSRLVLVSGLGAITGPVIAAITMNAVGPEGFFWFLGATNAAIALFATWRLTRRAAAAEADRSHFAMVPANEPSVLTSQLIPDAWDDDEQPVFATEELPAAVE